MAALDRGGRLAIAGIHLTDIPALNYERHLFQERELVSVTANSRRDGEEFLALAAEIPIRPTTTEYPFEMAAAALEDLARDAVNGAAVIRVSELGDHGRLVALGLAPGPPRGRRLGAGPRDLSSGASAGGGFGDDPERVARGGGSEEPLPP